MLEQIKSIATTIKLVKYAPFNEGTPDYTVGNQLPDFVFNLITKALYDDRVRKIYDKNLLGQWDLACKNYNNLSKEQAVQQFVDNLCKRLYVNNYCQEIVTKEIILETFEAFKKRLYGGSGDGER